MSKILAVAMIAISFVADVKSAGAGEVHGSVVMSPACPGPMVLKGSGRDCAPRPFQTTVEIASEEASSRTRAAATTKVVTDSSGRFKVVLPPGRYRLVPLSPQPATTGKPADVTVGAKTVTEVTLTVDSGLR